MHSRFPIVEPTNRSHRDLRSSSISHKRARDRYHKYSKFRSVNQGQLSNPQYEDGRIPFRPSWPLEVGDAYGIVPCIPVKEFLQLSRSARGWCNHGARCPLKRAKEMKHQVEFRRGSRFAKEMANCYLKTGFALRPFGWRGDADSMHEQHDIVVDENTCDECCRLRLVWDDVRMANLMEDCSAWTPCYLGFGAEKDDDTGSVVSAHTLDWSDVGSVVSWDDYDVVADDVSEWSEVEGEDIPSL